MFTKILIPTDGSPLSNQAAKRGIELAKTVNAEVLCVFIAREAQNPAFDFSEIRLPQHVTHEEYMEAVDAAARALMLPLRQFAETNGIPFTKLIEVSNTTASKIVQVAEENECDLIFMGSQGSAGWASMLLGSVASKVVAMSQIPVTVYKVKKPAGLD